MPPKKAATETSTSSRKMPAKPLKEDTKADRAASEAPKPVRKGSSHPSTMVMVKEALKVLDQRKGVSAHAICNFIKEKYTTVDHMRLKPMVNKALVKGLESNIFVKPPNSAMTKGVQGRFRLAVRKPIKDPKAAKKSKESKENMNPNVGEGEAAKAKPGAAKEKPAKKRSAAEGDKPKAKKDATASKVVQAKKPKSKSSAETDEPKANKKTGKVSKNDGEDSGKSSKRGKKAAQEEGTNDSAGATAPKKGKKDSQRAEGGDETAEATVPKRGKKAARAEDGEQNGTTAPKATGKKGKKAAEK